MSQPSFSVGDAVRITAGSYEDAEGIIEDLHPECDAVRVRAKSGAVYGFVESLMPLTKGKELVLRK